jgi:hypothetical protein
MFMALARTPLGSVLRHVPFLEAAYNHRALERQLREADHPVNVGLNLWWHSTVAEP